MDVILGFVEQLLTYLNEGEAAGIITIIKDSGVIDAIVSFFESIIAMF